MLMALFLQMEVQIFVKIHGKILSAHHQQRDPNCPVCHFYWYWLVSFEGALLALQGVIQSGYAGWNSLQPVACLKAPCYFSDPVSTHPFSLILPPICTLMSSF